MLYDSENKENSLDILTIQDLMSYLAIGKSTAYKLLKTRRIKSFKIGRNHKIPIQAVKEFVETSST